MIGSPPPLRTEDHDPIELYLDLLKQVLTRELFLRDDELRVDYRPVRADNWKRFLLDPTQRWLARKGYGLTRRVEGSPVKDLRRTGQDWPESAETMIGRERLDHLHWCVECVLTEGIPGDLVETGVWRGGAVIFMCAVLAAHGDSERIVWAADSFQGLPKASHEHDLADDLSEHDVLAVTLDQVKENFAKYGLLDQQVRFLPGWFKDSLPDAPIEKLALARLDGDYYESTWDAIAALYPKLSPGGFLIVDDYGIIDGCRRAITDYRNEHDIVAPVETIDQAGVFWRKP